MEEKRILLNVHNRFRDTLGLTYLKMLLEKKGYKVKLQDGNTDNFFIMFKFLPHVIVLGQVIQFHGATMAKYAKVLGTHVVNLWTEGGYLDKLAIDSFFPPKEKRCTENYDEAIDLNLVWSKNFGKVFIKKTGMKQDKIKICGSPRFDIYKLPLSKIMMNRKSFCKKYRLDPNKKNILYAENLIFASMNMKHADKSLDHVETLKLLKFLKKTQSEIRELATNNFFRLAKEINANFIIKIHPWGSADYYIKRLAKEKLKNVTIIKREWLWDVLNNTDILLHTNTTASTEAWFLNKPVITMSFIKKYEKDLAKFVEGSNIVRNYKELLKWIKHYIKGGKIPNGITNKRNMFTREWYYRVDGKSTKRAAEFIDNYIKTHDIKPKRRMAKHLIKYIFKHDLRRVIKHFIYNRKMLRNIYLKLRWKKSADSLKFMEEEYSKGFNDMVKEIEDKIRAVV